MRKYSIAFDYIRFPTWASISERKLIKTINALKASPNFYLGLSKLSIAHNKDPHTKNRVLGPSKWLFYVNIFLILLIFNCTFVVVWLGSCYIASSYDNVIENPNNPFTGHSDGHPQGNSKISNSFKCTLDREKLCFPSFTSFINKVTSARASTSA